PALYNLLKENNLPRSFAVVSIGRRNLSREEYLEQIKTSIITYGRYPFDEDTWSELRNLIYYKQMDFTDISEYESLKSFLNEVDIKHHTNGNRIYYLAVAPEFFEVIVDNLAKTNLNKHEGKFTRVMIEKPFGRNLQSAIYLNQKIIEVFGEENTYRIDHYLGKEMLQNIMVIRFANSLFEPVWNKDYIEQIQITASETIGVGSRGNYYENAGAIRDMVQSHLLQLLSLIAMERPKDLSPNSVRDEKVKVLQKLKPTNKEDIKKSVVRGQYKSYRHEPNVSPTSNTETFVALKLEVDTPRWKNVPFYVRTGKKLPRKAIEIIIQFKHPEKMLYDNLTSIPNMLIIKVQPQEGIYLVFNAKKPGTKNTIIPVQMDFCQNCYVGINTPEAYERLLLDAFNGDSTLFARWDEVLYSWKFIDAIIETWQDDNVNLPHYEDGSYGPEEANALLARDGREWINLED
ncbi:MAG: glucose-6-phosphate dehydrogenase, partial [Bacilli bacterium]|nr:glucose-6-phosphate dehydrogenase [Bacilli bacterium]